MTNISLPGFETLQKLQGFAVNQLRIFVKVLSDGPAEFLEQLQGSPDERLAEATKLLAFVIVLSSLITIPLDYAIWHVDITEVGVVACALIMWVIIVLVFCLLVHAAALALGGKATFKACMTAMFFSSVYLPMIELTKYLERLDPIDKSVVLNEGFQVAEFGPMMFIAAAVQAGLIFYVVLKLGGVMRVTYDFGRVRSVSAIVIAGTVHSLFGFYVTNPMWAAIVAHSTAS